MEYKINVQFKSYASRDTMSAAFALAAILAGDHLGLNPHLEAKECVKLHDSEANTIYLTRES